MNNPTILIVEDDSSVRNLIATTLRSHEYEYITVQNGADALAAASAEGCDIMLLDLGLPDMDGLEVIERVRSWSKMPIIVISARNADSAKVTALDSGADDFLTKPFSVEELLARIRVTQRRLEESSDQITGSVYENGDLKIDYAAGCAYIGGEELHLTPTEYRILCLLAKNAGRVLTHTYLTQQIWGSSWDNDIASLRVHLATLRKKIEKDTRSPQYIQTHVGVGYRMLKHD
ncbi:MAG: response regulator transcription factor [Eubacteriaceae bacterium]|nr:response regulator transcription factor [Eubacteriaceae bacterium]